MRKIINPWKGKNIYHCFGCDEENETGLHMQFWDDGDKVVCNWEPKKKFEGYKNTLHGGIQSTMHDEIASWVIYTKGETAGMTTDLHVQYKKSVLIDQGPIRITGQIKEQDRRFIKVHTQLFNQQNELCSEGLVTYRIFPKELAISKMHYPGIEAFYE